MVSLRPTALVSLRPTAARKQSGTNNTWRAAQRQLGSVVKAGPINERPRGAGRARSTAPPNVHTSRCTLTDPVLPLSSPGTRRYQPAPRRCHGSNSSMKTQETTDADTAGLCWLHTAGGKYRKLSKEVLLLQTGAEDHVQGFNAVRISSRYSPAALG